MANAATMLYMKYDRVRLTVDEVAHELDMQPGSVRNQISRGVFPVASYTEGRNRFVDVRELGAYLDRMLESARLAHRDDLVVQG